MAEAGRFDVFVSYAHEDEPWATALAGNLERLGLRVWLDQWELVGGELVAARLQQGLEQSDAVVPVVTGHWKESGWCGEEFASAVTAAVARRQRLIPAVAGDVDLPGFIASRLHIDFRHAASPARYKALVGQLARAVRGLPSGERPEDGELEVPDTTAYRPDGPAYAELSVRAESVTFSTVDGEASCAPHGVDRGLEQRLWALRRAGARAAGGLATRRPPVPETAPAGPTGALIAVGEALGARFVRDDVATALAHEERLARSRHASLRIGLEVDDPRWTDLPWETLVVPGTVRPLVLSEQVELYRRVRRESAPVAVRVPGPLRILAVVASPESGAGELLDYERELSRILDAVDPARSGYGAYVRVLNWGSLAEIRSALEQERFHVLHLSCHAKPGVLLLEDERGRADEVDAERFLAEALPTDRGVPLVVLAGCSTARTAASPEAEDAGIPDAATETTETPDTADATDDTAGTTDDAPEPTDEPGEPGDVHAPGRIRAGLARELLVRGVPAVLAMTEPVTDHYATELAAEMYESLARAEQPDPLNALSRARRTLEARRRRLPENDPRAAWPEWATPALFLSGPPLPLFARAPGADRAPVAREAVLDEGIVVRKVGEFVGRRAELRRLLSALRDPRRAGVLVHGIGGVGKSTLAAELLHHYGTRERLVVPVAATTTRTVDAVLETLRQRLNTHCAAEGLPETDPLRRAALALMDAHVPWRERWELVRQIVLPRLSVLMIVDNAEDLLTRTGDGDGWEVADPELADLLAAWAAAAPRTRLLVTSRHPFGLPRRAHRRLTAHHLGPLSLAETRKLIWRLPGLDALGPAEQQRAYTDVGGHPRALEYLDALLRGGEARFPDIADRMETALEARGIHDPERWLADVAGDFDTALAETVTLAVDDVLLDALLAQLEDIPEARRLLDGMAVYRTPVDRTGAAWQLSEVTEAPRADPALHERVGELNARIAEIRAADTGTGEKPSLPPELVAEYNSVWAELSRPPVTLDDRAGEALRRLLETGLLAPAPTDQDDPGAQPSGLVVHRWTADALHRRARPDTLKAAHRRAAAYWQWRVNVWPQPLARDVVQLIEVRHHHHQAGDLDKADGVTRRVRRQLHTWGAWDWEQHLLEESLTWVSKPSEVFAAYTHCLGIIAQERGDYARAVEQYRAALSVFEELGDRSGIANCHGQLGIVTQLLGDLQQAEVFYHAALSAFEELGERVGIANGNHQLGILAQVRENYEEAESRYRKALAIAEELGDRAGVTNGNGQLGVLAQVRGDYDEAESRYRIALAIAKEDNSRLAIATSHHQLGRIAQIRREFTQAEEHYRFSLAVAEELGDRSGVASAYHQLGRIAHDQEDYEQAEEFYRAAAGIYLELGESVGIVVTLGQMGGLLTERGRPAEGVLYSLRVLPLAIEKTLPLDTALYWLRRQRELLGDEAFRAILEGRMESEVAEVVMNATQPPPAPPSPEVPSPAAAEPPTHTP